MCRCEFRVYVTAKRKCKYNRGNHYKKKPPQDDGAGALVERSGANLGGVGFGFGSGGISW